MTNEGHRLKPNSFPIHRRSNHFDLASKIKTSHMIDFCSESQVENWKTLRLESERNVRKFICGIFYEYT